MSLRLASAAVVALTLACQPAAPACRPPSLACRTTPAPTFDELYASVLLPRCGTGGSCHVEDDVPAGGLRLDDPEIAFAMLTAPSQQLVVAGQPECSEIERRLRSTDRFVRMPPAAFLPAGEICSVVAWIEAGAER